MYNIVMVECNLWFLINRAWQCVRAERREDSLSLSGTRALPPTTTTTTTESSSGVLYLTVRRRPAADFDEYRYKPTSVAQWFSTFCESRPPIFHFFVMPSDQTEKKITIIIGYELMKSRREVEPKKSI